MIFHRVVHHFEFVSIRFGRHVFCSVIRYGAIRRWTRWEKQNDSWLFRMWIDVVGVHADGGEVNVVCLDG